MENATLFQDSHTQTYELGIAPGRDLHALLVNDDEGDDPR